MSALCCTKSVRMPEKHPDSRRSDSVDDTATAQGKRQLKLFGPFSAQLCFRNGCPGPDKPAASPHSHVQVRRRLQRPWRLLLCPLARRVAGCSSSPEDAALHEVQAAWSMPAWRELPVCAWAKRASQSLGCRPWPWPARAPVASGHGAQPGTNAAKQPHGLQGSWRA